MTQTIVLLLSVLAIALLLGGMAVPPEALRLRPTLGAYAGTFRD